MLLLNSGSLHSYETSLRKTPPSPLLPWSWRRLCISYETDPLVSTFLGQPFYTLFRFYFFTCIFVYASHVAYCDFIRALGDAA